MTSQPPAELETPLPVGTQVVTRLAVILTDGAVRPPGAVGVVVQAPAEPAARYRVRFLDGTEVEYDRAGSSRCCTSTACC